MNRLKNSPNAQEEGYEVDGQSDNTEEYKHENNIKRGASVLEASMEQGRAEVEYWASEYISTETAFAHRQAKNGNKLSYEELLRWEDDAQYNFKRIKEMEVEAGFPSRYERDKAEKIGRLNPDTSIEAESGNYYLRRQRALNEAITNSDNPNKIADLDATQQLYQFVGEHIYCETDYEARSSSPAQYQARRRAAHNRLIKQLNHLNDLADQYGVRRFTFRNFETNDFLYNEHQDIGGYTNARAEYDRASVEAYCRNAFSGEYDRAAREQRSA